MSPEQLERVDRELSSFGKTDEALAEVTRRARSVRGGIDDLDAALEALGAGRSMSRGRQTAESKAPPGTVAHPTTWEEARTSNRAPHEDDVGSGLLMVDEALLRASDLPPVLAPPETMVMSKETALYIDPPTNPPPGLPLARRAGRPETGDSASMEMAIVPASEDDAQIREALAEEAGEPALALDPEVGLVEPGAEPMTFSRSPTQPPPQARPSAIPVPSTDELLREVLDTPDSEPPVAVAPPPPPPPAPLSVAENETADALAALDSGFNAMDEDEVQPERTVMMNADALRPVGVPAEGDDFELDIDEDVMVIDDVEEEVAQAAPRSRPPPPPPSQRPNEGKSRPPEPPGKGFLSRLLKSNKPSS